jgi:hypothetical protein
MPSPFPGMDPYLEREGYWSTFRARLLLLIAEAIQSEVRPRYWVGVEERLYHTFPGEPVSFATAEHRRPVGGTVHSGPVGVIVPVREVVRESYLAVQHPRTSEVVTVIEMLTPGNKTPGPGREYYLQVRNAALWRGINVVEIDLRRGGQRIPLLEGPQGYDYSVLVCCAGDPRSSRLYPFSMREPAPSFPVPLSPDEPEVCIGLSELLANAYEGGGFGLVVDYGITPAPALSGADAEWAAALLAQRQP